MSLLERGSSQVNTPTILLETSQLGPDEGEIIGRYEGLSSSQAERLTMEMQEFADRWITRETQTGEPFELA